VVVGAGAASLLNHAFTLLLSPGDAVLIPAPYYAAFENDMKVLAGCVPIAVPCADASSGPTPKDLQAAFDTAEADGLTVGMVLLTNPNNPLGCVYSPGVVQAAISWSRSRGLQTIVDEIYALSTFDESAVETFESVLKHGGVPYLGNDVHVVWALSKDFGASGFRCGFLVTGNEDLKQALGNVNCFSCLSHPMQLCLADVLSDVAFVDSYLAASRAALSKCYNITTTALSRMNIPFTPAVAGMFLWIDLRGLLPEDSWEGEEAVTTLLFDEGGLVLTPGGAQRANAPGFYRLCFAWNTVDVLNMAMERIDVVVKTIRARGWVDLEVEERDDFSPTNGIRRRGSSYCGE
jgi:1-aminocyclopropane-1-carboxylate synthase